MAASHCPNKNVPEWKRMVKHVGEREAYRAYMANGHTIPPAMDTSDFKKKIGLVNGPFNSQQQSAINHELRKYNRANGTSHRIKYTIIGNTGRQSKAELIHNYLPVDLEAQSQMRMRDRNKGFHAVQDGESFLNVQNLNTTPFTPSELQAEAGRDEDGEFLPPSYSPTSSKISKKARRFQPYIDMKQDEIDHLFTERNRLTVKIREMESETTPNKEAIHKLRIQREKVKNDTDRNQAHKARASVLKRLEDIAGLAEADIRTLEDIFSNEEWTGADLRTATRIIDIWSKAGDFTGNGPHIYFDEKEFENRTKGLKETTARYKRWKDRVEDFSADLIKLKKDFIRREKNTKDTFSNVDVDFETPTKDVGWITQQTLDLSQTDNVLFQISHRFVKDANTAGHFELFDRHKEIDRLAKATGLTNYDSFQQRFANDDDRKTGEMVYWFSYKYDQWKTGLKRDLKKSNNKALRQKSEKRKNAVRLNANRSHVKKLQDHTELFDARILFFRPEFMGGEAPSQADIDEHTEMLKDLLGEEVFNRYYKLAEQKITEFEGDFESRKAMMEAEFAKKGDVVAQRDMDIWIARNSPFVHAELMEEGFNKTKYKGLMIFPTSDYVVHVPKRESHGKDLGYYDDAYNKIKQNPKQSELYNYLFDLFVESVSYLPNEKVNFMNENAIPYLEKKTVEAMTGEDGNLAAGFTRFQEQALNSVRMDDLTVVSSSDEKNKLQIGMIKDQRQRIRDYIDLKDTEYRKARKIKTGAPAAMIEEWRRQIMSEIAKEKSFDLPRLAKAFSTVAFTHKHKSSIEVFMRNMEDIIHRTNEREENAAGEQMTDRNDNVTIDDKKKPERSIQMWDDFVEAVFWGYPSNRPEGKGKKTVYTKAEKQKLEDVRQGIKDLDELRANKQIPLAEYNRRSLAFEKQLAELGGVRVASKVGDWLLRYNQFLGMGWNGFAAVANMGFGFMANAIEGSDGRNYSQDNFRKAFFLAMNSVLRNYSFNTLNGRNGNGAKIRAVMDRFDVLKQSKDELYESGLRNPFARISKVFKWMNPYSPQSRTEYFNQAPVMIAILLEEKVKDADGNEITMWDAMDIDGNFKEGIEVSADKLLEAKATIDGLVKMNHGNYDPDSKISAKKTWIGRALFQFRTWAPQGFAERIRTPMNDHQLTNRMTGEDFVEKKGRYRSFGTYYQQTKWLGPVGTIADLLYNLTRKLFFQTSTFQNRADDNEDASFTATDAANMRKNLTELLFLLGMIAVTALLKAGADDEDDEEKQKRKTLALNFLINSAARLQTDILFYLSPVEFERLTKNAMPMFGLISDSMGLIDSAWVLIWQGAEEDILQSGTNRGQSETWNDAKEIIPILSQIKKAPKAAQMIYKK